MPKQGTLGNLTPADRHGSVQVCSTLICQCFSSLLSSLSVRFLRSILINIVPHIYTPHTSSTRLVFPFEFSFNIEKKKTLNVTVQSHDHRQCVSLCRFCTVTRLSRCFITSFIQNWLQSIRLSRSMRTAPFAIKTFICCTMFFQKFSHSFLFSKFSSCSTNRN